MVKLAVSALTVTLLAGSTIAAPTFYEGADLKQRSLHEFDGLAFKGLKTAFHTVESIPQGGNNQNQNQNQRRKVELEERSPLGIFSIVKDVAKVGEHAISGTSNNNQNRRREVELEERSPFGIFSIAKDVFKVGEKAVSAIGGGGNNQNNQKHRRELELEERSPFGIFSIAKDAFKVGENLVGAGNNKNHRRSLDEDTILVTREDLDELLRREYYDDLD